jgi:hypothetical protein
MDYFSQPTGTLTIREAIEAIQTRTGVRIAIASLYRLIQKGARGRRLACIRVAGRIYVRTVDLDAYLTDCNSADASPHQSPASTTPLRASRRSPERQEQIDRVNDDLRRRLGRDRRGAGWRTGGRGAH